jgi:hypothetical protein
LFLAVNGKNRLFEALAKLRNQGDIYRQSAYKYPLDFLILQVPPQSFLFGIHQKEAAFIVREHQGLPVEIVSEPIYIGEK